MSQENAIIKVNSNYHHLAGENLLEREDASFRQYRKKWKEWPENFYIGDFPLFIDVEVTSICNLKCPFCATTYRGKKIKKGFISFDTVKKIIDEGTDNKLYGVKFSFRGEPLLHPQLHEFVRYAKEKGLIDVYFNTNAVLLTEEISKRLIDSGLDRISISFEGYTKVVYENYRVSANFEVVLANIKNLQTLKKKIGVKHPRTRIQTVMLKGLEFTFEEYKKFWSQWADEVAFIDYKQMKERRKGVRYLWACPQLWQRMAIWWDGTILPCNHDDDGKLTLGNIKQTSIKKAWHSKDLNRIRGIHKRGRADRVPACDGCYLRDSEIIKLTKKGKI